MTDFAVCEVWRPSALCWGTRAIESEENKGQVWGGCRRRVFWGPLFALGT